jgi:CheY-like chemotaxis protein
MPSQRREQGTLVCWNCHSAVDALIRIAIQQPPGGKVTVPICHACYDSVYLPLAAEAQELRQVDSRGRSVLIVDDDPNIRGLLTTLFKGEGFSVDTATNGLEALSKANAHVPDAIVLDLRMPVMDGQEFLRAWCETTSGPSVPVLAISAYDVRMTAAELRVQAFLPKPFSMAALLSAVDHLIDPSGTQQHSLTAYSAGPAAS